MAITPHPAPVPRGPVTAKLNFSHPLPAGITAFNYVDTPPAGEPQRNLTPNPRAVNITDIRGREADFSLDHDAFQILQHIAPSAEESASNFLDDKSIATHYYPEVERLLLDAIPGSTRIHIFDHTIRRAAASAPRKAVQNVHVDQTAYSAAKRVQRHMGDDAAALLQGRYRIVNVWRTLNKNPVESMPLAFASSSTLEDADVVPVEHRYPEGYVGQTAAITYNPNQKWYYLSGMTGDERLLLECYDSEGAKEGSGVAGGRVPHSAFEDPRTRPDAEGRESIEVRALVFGP
ncbi:uncharacterized protein GGS22DRAFT_163506 [Annulohypoxylon maeteangense]|uniref:uncharacterized protein n=1 Tax=Annulohypoxylon maeteangense TaxID=1927788 RepID=UPI00200724FB|nr:uncharacterized protein GGS22DRAFT_163506 [Annulohypoxylon maeteangense]KAI0885360.1 hypothetical protein GGS22DRAFT_163506 [Annulohypoxylon maeteangense]